jgi:syntaxin 7
MSHDIERGYGNNGRGYQSGYGGNGGGYGNRSAPPSNDTGFGSQSVEDPLVSAVKENIKQMSTNVTSIQKSVSVLGTNRDGQELRDRLAGTIETTKILARDTTAQLKQLSTHNQGSNQNKMVHQKLTKDFSVWLGKFQEISKISAQKERTLLPPKQPPPLQNRTPDTFPQAHGNYDDYHTETEKQSLLEASRKQQLLQLENEREFNDALIQDREMGIKQIETAVVEVNEIFTDLANLVHEQGFMIDNIESNIESTAVQTQAGVKELQAASKHQRSARSKLCILAVIIAIIAGVVTLILVLSLKK